MNAKYSNLISNYNELSTKYNDLMINYTSLKSEYSTLLQMKEYYGNLSNDVLKFKNLIYSYIGIPEVFPRVLNEDAIKKTSNAVINAGVVPSNLWISIQKIYDYITTNIKYAYDIEMPYISTYWSITYDGKKYVTKFYDGVKTIEQYVQTPELTLKIKQGDCDDQAILAYAMIKYYMKYINGTENDLYIALIEFSKGDEHLSVILPVQSGKLCIIDPAGHYLTKSEDIITSKETLSELQAYSNYWSDTTGPITNIALYKINVTDGSYTLFANGTISQVASAFQ
ncbi:MAG: hypothetical protein EF809_01540 [Candidatus Methanomethylicota archaeon]|jgi:hypothetical protein|uniref:Transglutaminase-like domain-containing protein n=2 Tax=Thermoproteota archaeon TaxID=2056631 RepID=A0A520KGG2_9CREN|nr:MAG: hypothetical protein EF809_01540 [Candidatus Verstraetearchaeota archaeon]